MIATSTLYKALMTLTLTFALLPISCLANSPSQIDSTLRQLKELHNLPPEGQELENLKAKLLEIHNNEFEDPEYIPYSKSSELSQIEENIE